MRDWLGIFAGIAIVSGVILGGTARAESLKVRSRPTGVTFTSFGTKPGNVAPEFVGEGHAVMPSVADEQTTFIAMTHGVGLARDVADRLLGAAKAVLGNPRHPRIEDCLKRVLKHV